MNNNFVIDEPMKHGICAKSIVVQKKNKGESKLIIIGGDSKTVNHMYRRFVYFFCDKIRQNDASMDNQIKYFW